MDATTMKKTDAELFRMATPNVAVQTIGAKLQKSSRIDIIGQNGNEGLHYKPTVFAIQSLFQYGWDFIGFNDEDGLREVFKTEKEALIELTEICHFTGTPKEEWRIVPYNPYEDDTFARF